MPEGAYSAGTIFLQVVPSYRGLQESIRRKVGDVDKALSQDMEANAAETGTRVGKVLGDNIAKESEKGAKKASEKYEGAFRDSLRRAALAGQRELDHINFDTASEKTLTQLEEIKRRMRDLGKTKIDADFDGAKAMAEVKALDKALGDIQKNRRIDEVFDLSAAQKHVKRLGKTFDDELGRIKIPDKVLKQVDRDMGAFERTVKKHMKTAFDSIGDNAEPGLKKLRARMEQILNADFDIDMDSGHVVAEVEKIKLALNSLKTNHNVDINTRGDAAAAAESVNKLNAAFADLEPQVEKVDRQMSKFSRDFQKNVKKAMSELGDDEQFKDLHSRLDSLKDIDLDVEVDSGPALRELAAVAAAAKAVGAISPDVRIQTNAAAAVASMGAAGAAGGAASGIGSGLSGAGGEADDAANSFRAFNGILLAVLTIGSALIPVVAALAGGIAALSVAAIGAGTGLGVMLLGFSGISDAVKALGDVQKNAAKDALQQSKDLRNALQAIADAERALSRARVDAAQANADAARTTHRAIVDAAQANQDAARNIIDAQRSAAAANEDAARRVVQAQEAAARAVADALGRQQDAEESLADAQRDARQAVEDLRQARKDAAADLESIRDQQRQNALDERQAVIDLFNATVANNAAQQDPGATNLEKEQASINLGNAKERLHEIREEETRLADERKKGINGTQRVQDAQDAVTQALEAQQNAQEALGDASAAVDQARLDGARAITDALRDQKDVAREGARAIRDAERQAKRTRIDGANSVADAVRQQHRTEVDGTHSVADAQRALRRAQQDYQDALKKTGDIGSTSMSTLRQAMGKLSPAGRRFARYLFSLRGLFYDIRAAAQEGMLPGVQNALQLIVGRYGKPFERFVRRMGRQVGHLFEILGRRLTGGGFEDFFGMLNRLGPRFTRQFGKALIDWMEFFASWAVSTAPFAKRMSNALLGMSDAALKWMQSGKGSESWQKFMRYAFRVGPMVVDFFKQLWGAALNLGRALAPLGGFILKALTGILGFIANMDPDLLGVIAMAIMGIVFAFQLAAAAIAIMFIVMSPIGSVVGGVALVIGLLIGVIVILYTKSKTARKIINGVFSAIGEVISWLWKHITKPYLGAMGKLFSELGKGYEWVWKHVLKPVFEAIGDAIKWLWKNVVKPVFNFIKDHIGDQFRAIVWIWKNILWPIIRTIGQIMWELWKLHIKIAFAAILEGWHLLKDGFLWVWRHWLKPLFDGFMDLIGDDLVKAFKDGIDAIKRNWDRIKEIAKAPVRFLIETVMNKGIIGGFNWLAEKTGMKEIKPIPLPKGFARGGIPSARDMNVYPGYTPGRDTGFIGIGGGEGIIRPEATRVLGESWINSVNAAARRGGQGAVKALLGGFAGGFAKGGIIKNFGKRVWPVPGRDVSTYPGHDGIDINRGSGWDDFGDPIRAAAGGTITYVGTAHGYGNAIFERGPYGTVVYGHTSRQHVKAGQSVWAGDLIGNVGTSGNSSAPHLHFGFPGGTAPEARAFLAGALHLKANDPSWTSALGAGLDKLGALVKNAISAPLEWLTDKISAPIDSLQEKFGDNFYTDAITKFPEMAIKGVADWVKSKITFEDGAAGSFPGVPAGAFGPGAEGIFKSLMSTKFYSPQQAAGVMGNMEIESGLDPYIVQGGGHKKMPYGVSSGWGLVQWTPGTKILPYLHGDSSVASQVSALTAQLRGSESYAGGKIKSAKTPSGAAYAFGKWYERPQDLGDTIEMRRHYAEMFFDRFRGGHKDGGVVEGGQPVPYNGTELYDTGGTLPPGLTSVLNLTGQSERAAVFTNEQWADLHRNPGGGGWHYEPHFEGSDLDAGDVADNLLFTIGRIQRGGVYTGARGD